MDNVRVRIAPSPSGFLHIGTAKTALFNWLFARHNGGQFILRLEDTDAARTQEEYAGAMCEGLRWLGIEWDEGPEFAGEPQKGDRGPYRQSLRKEQHRAAAERLVAAGKAYKCFASKEEMDELREAAKAKNQRPPYNSPWRDAPPEKVEAMGGSPCTIRFRVPEGATCIDDMVQGEVRFDNADFDDFVLVRPNGEPLFHLAVVADDGEMGISHVIRGDDHLTNAARHQMLFEALGYPVPRFAHLPMVLDETGKKYSKRMHGANVLDWRSDGFLAEALINYVALLGWTPREPNRELFTLDELVAHFEAARWGASAAKFDRKKLEWLNGQHIRRLSPVELRDRVTPLLEAAGFDLSAKSPEWLARMAEVCQEKIPTLNAIVEMTDFFFVEPKDYEEKAAKKHFGREDAQKKLDAVYELLEQVDPFTHEAMKTVFTEKAEEWGVGLGQFIHPTRLALTGKSVGPGLFELAELLGRKTCLDRVDRAIEYVEKGGPSSS